MADGTTFAAGELDQNEVIVLGERTGTLVITGKRNRVTIGEGARFDGQIEITGDDNVIEIGAWATVRASNLRITCSFGAIRVGDSAAIVNSSLQVPETSEIVIGRETGIAIDSWLSTSDGHPMYDVATGHRINPARSILIGEKVGGGLRCIYLKGCRIGDGAVIGAGSVVRGRIPAASLVSGNPAKVHRTGVRWEWDFPQTASAPSNSGRAATA